MKWHSLVAHTSIRLEVIYSSGHIIECFKSTDSDVQGGCWWDNNQRVRLLCLMSVWIDISQWIAKTVGVLGKRLRFGGLGIQKWCRSQNITKDFVRSPSELVG